MSAIWLQRGSDFFAAVEGFISSHIWGVPRRMPGDTIIASANISGAIIGAAIYQNYQPDFGTIEISAAAISPRWLSRPILREMFEYPFDQLKCQAVVMRCDADHARLARIFGAYGFKRYDIPRLRGREKPEAIYVLADNDWRENGYHKGV